MRKLSVLLCVGLVACGGGSGGGTSPAPIVNAPSISPADTMIYVGQVKTFSASGGGTIRWGGDNSQVATVDQTTGRVTGVGNGRVTIWAENEGGRTTRLLRGLPSFNGSWVGNYRVTGCAQSGTFALANTCRDFFTGSSWNMGMSFVQTDDRISGGTVNLGALNGTLTSTTVTEQGDIRVTGTIDPLAGNPIRVFLENVALHSPSAGSLQGSHEVLFGSTTQSGTMRVFGAISLTRTSGAPLVSQSEVPAGPTFADLLRLMR